MTKNFTETPSMSLDYTLVQFLMENLNTQCLRDRTIESVETLARLSARKKKVRIDGQRGLIVSGMSDTKFAFKDDKTGQIEDISHEDIESGIVFNTPQSPDGGVTCIPMSVFMDADNADRYNYVRWAFCVDSQKIRQTAERLSCLGNAFDRMLKDRRHRLEAEGGLEA